MKPRGWIIVALVLCAAVGAAVSWCRFRPGDGAAEIPRVSLDGADPEAAASVRFYSDRVEKSPESAGAWGTLGMTFLAHELFAPAIQCLERASLLGPGEPRWPYLEGYAHWKGGSSPAEAIRGFEQAAAIVGSDPAARLKLGQTLLEQGRPEEAEGQFRLVLGSFPGSAQAMAGVGRALHARGEWGAAREFLEASVKAAPQVRATHALLAEVYFRIGLVDDAERERGSLASLPNAAPWPDPYYQQVIELRAGVVPRIERANELCARGRAPEAIQLSRETVDRYPKSLLPRLSLGRMLLQLGDASAASEVLLAAVALEPASFEAQYELGSALLRQGNSTAALAAFQRAGELRPDFAPSHHARGQCLLRAGDVNGAIEAFRAAVRYRPNYAQAHKDLGRSLVSRAIANDAAEGLEHLRAAARLNPRDAETQKWIEAAAK